jgi:phosphoserine aminotransferase
MVSLVLDWLIAQGGVAKMATGNAAKAKRLYGYIDSSDYYHNAVDPAVRSRMNVVFDLPDAAMQPAFLAMAERMHLVGLKGHSAVGGMRASIYNAVSMVSVEALIAMMEAFKHEYPRPHSVNA